MRKLTSKQREFIKQKLENPGISNSRAAIAAGYSPNTAKNALKNIIENRGTQKFIERLANDDVLAFKLNEGLEAYRVDITGDKQPDFKTRLEYIREMLGLKGYKTEPPNLNQVNVDMNLEFIGKDESST